MGVGKLIEVPLSSVLMTSNKYITNLKRDSFFWSKALLPVGYVDGPI